MIFGKKRRRINRLMIVEDEPLIAFDNENFLSGAGYEIVATVNKAAAALPELDAGRAPDAIILDYYLADGTTGVELALEAKRRNIAVLFVTGICPEDARPYAMGCLSKPYSQKDLLASLEALEALLVGEEPKLVPPALELFVDAGPNKSRA